MWGWAWGTPKTHLVGSLVSTGGGQWPGGPGALIFPPHSLGLSGLRRALLKGPVTALSCPRCRLEFPVPSLSLRFRDSLRCQGPKGTGDLA